MSMRNEIREERKQKEEEEILRQAAKIINSRYPDPDKDEWGYKKHFSS